ncbi:hypothetical protein M405DRAFT_409237 [Rhizopogon salebrosus TDB-379]|nr:hypothetical protein M405DRAFT_409237 [Rhizopogon salebrosus TDB-379]
MSRFGQEVTVYGCLLRFFFLASRAHSRATGSSDLSAMTCAISHCSLYLPHTHWPYHAQPRPRLLALTLFPAPFPRARFKAARYRACTTVNVLYARVAMYTVRRDHDRRRCRHGQGG